MLSDGNVGLEFSLVVQVSQSAKHRGGFAEGLVLVEMRGDQIDSIALEVELPKGLFWHLGFVELRANCNFEMSLLFHQVA